MSYKCKLILSLNEDEELNITLDNPGNVSPLMLAGALDLVKFGLQSSLSGGIVDRTQENPNADNSI